MMKSERPLTVLAMLLLNKEAKVQEVLAVVVLVVSQTFLMKCLGILALKPVAVEVM